MNNILILYSTTDGHTIKISQRIQLVLEKVGHEVKVLPIASADVNELHASDKIIIGASIRYGKHQKEVVDFVSEYKSLLEEKPSVFFSVSVVARKPNRNTPETNPYVKKFLSGISWKPDAIGIFAGKIDYPKYGVLDRTIIRLIMYMTKGPTDPNAVVEFTDWDKVESFGQMVG